MPALDWKRAPELLAELKARPEPIARLMTFILATVSRCGAARVAKRKYVDPITRTWTIPIADLKDSAHRKEPLVVMLNDVALSAIPAGHGEYVFTNEHGQTFTDQDIVHFIRKLRLQHPDWIDGKTGRAFTAHGMRAMFRSWAASTRQDRDLTEICMGHTTAYGQVEGVYVRDDLLEPRREIMERWGRHCRGSEAVILPLRRA